MERMRAKQAKLSLEHDEKSDELIEEQEVENYEEDADFGVTQDIGHTRFMTQHTFSTQTEAYNPDQDKQEVLEIRRSYAHLREELTTNNRELIKADSSKLSELIDEANAVFSRVHTTSDASLDSKFMTDTADLGVAKVHKLPLCVSEFSLDSYLRIVNQYLTTCSWGDMGNLLSAHWVGVETTDFMLGSMELEIKKRAPPTIAARAARSEVGPMTTPLTVDLKSNVVTPEELSKETSENVMKVYSVLEGIGSFPFYHFITDPQSFARTVENMFYVSFLVRDCRARVFVPQIAASTNELYIEAISPDDEEEEEQDEQEQDGNPFNQLVLGMTTKIWRRTVEKYKIDRPFLVLS